MFVCCDYEELHLSLEQKIIILCLEDFLLIFDALKCIQKSPNFSI